MTVLDYRNPDALERFPDVPEFFRYHWSSDAPLSLSPPGGLVIYGYSARSTYAEDHRLEDRSFAERGTFPSVCFSVQCLDGEYGFTLHDAVTSISREEFEAAMARGFVS